MKNIMKAAAFILLLICGYTDLRHRVVDLRFVFGMTVVSFFLRWRTDGSITYIMIIYGTILALLLCLSKAFKGAIGEGDAYVTACLALLLGVGETVLIAVLGMNIAALSGLVRMLAGHKRFSEAYAFIPFMLISYIVLLCIGGIE